MPKKQKATPKETENVNAVPATNGKAPRKTTPRAKKTGAPRKQAAATRAKTAKPATSPKVARAHPRDEDIRLRAYFISERRHRLGLPGDSSADWLEAKRQLLSETGPK